MATVILRPARPDHRQRLRRPRRPHARACTSTTSGRPRPRGPRERLAVVPLAARGHAARWSAAARPPTRGRDPRRPRSRASATDTALTECDYGEWQGRTLQRAGQGSALEDRADPPVGGDVPGRGVDAGRCRRARSPPYAGATRASTAAHGADAVWVAVSHGDVIKSVLADALGHAPRPVPADPGRPGVGLGRPLHRRPALRARDQHPRGRPVAGSRRQAGEAAEARRQQPTAAPRSGGGAGPAATPPSRALHRVEPCPSIHEFDPPERFVAGTVGEPGQRTFFLQARAGPATGQRRAGEAAGGGARRAGRRAARRGDGQQRHRDADPGGRAGRARGHRARSSSRSRRSSASAR